MKRNKPSGTTQSGLAMVHANAAAIDIGATLHKAAVGADRSAEPVRCFGTFTTDLIASTPGRAERCCVTMCILPTAKLGFLPGVWTLDPEIEFIHLAAPQNVRFGCSIQHGGPVATEPEVRLSVGGVTRPWQPMRAH